MRKLKEGDTLYFIGTGHECTFLGFSVEEDTYQRTMKFINEWNKGVE